MKKPSIESLRQTDYMKLMAYTVSRAGNPFSKAEALKEAKVSEVKNFERYEGKLYQPTADDPNRYEGLADMLPEYISFRELDEAQAEAKIAKRIAIAAIGLSAVLSTVQVVGDVNLDEGQVNRLVQASQSIEKSQKEQMDKMSSKIDETNKMLIQLSAKPTPTRRPGL